MRTKEIWISLLLLMLLPIRAADAQEKVKDGFSSDPEIIRNENPKIKAENEKRINLQWYVIEPMAKYCREDHVKAPEDSEMSQQIIVAYSDFRARLRAVKLRDLTGLPVVKLDRESEEHAKFRVAMDLIRIHQRGKCKQ